MRVELSGLFKCVLSLTLLSQLLCPVSGVADERRALSYVGYSQCLLEYDSKQTNVISMLVIRAAYSEADGSGRSYENTINALSDAVKKRGCDIDSVDYMGLSGLHIAIIKIQTPLVKALLHLGADPSRTVTSEVGKYGGMNAMSLAEELYLKRPGSETESLRSLIYNATH